MNFISSVLDFFNQVAKIVKIHNMKIKPSLDGRLLWNSSYIRFFHLHFYDKADDYISPFDKGNIDRYLFL